MLLTNDVMYSIEGKKAYTSREPKLLFNISIPIDLLKIQNFTYYGKF